MRTFKLVSFFIATFLIATNSAYSQDSAAIRKKLESQYALTQPTADQTDIITPGAVLVLQKNSLTTVSVFGAMIYGTSTYKNGKINLNAAAKGSSWDDKLRRCPICPQIPRAPNPPPLPPTRIFLKNEKLWVTGINIKSDSVVFDLLTDPYGENRFKASLAFPFGKNATPDTVARLVAEVFTVEPDNNQNSKNEDQQSAGNVPGNQGPSPQSNFAAPPPPDDEPKAVIPPAPPPPPDQPAAPPKVTSIGQTKDEVIAALGQPDNIVPKGKTEIYFYKRLDIKVTFTGGKVSDIQ
jgi:hypothetical protein